MRYKPSRESFIPKKGATKVADKQSDAVAYLYTLENGKPAARVFVGKQAKPVVYSYFRDEARREAAVREAFESRRQSMAFKAELRAKRIAWVPDYTVGEILHTNWGYDQTNVEYFEVVEIKGKHVIVREIGQERTETGFMSGKCAPLRGKYIGEPLRRLAQETGIKIDDVRTAFRSRSKKMGGIEVHEPLYWSSYA
jgi:hypothetical protein